MNYRIAEINKLFYVQVEIEVIEKIISSNEYINKKIWCFTEHFTNLPINWNDTNKNCVDNLTDAKHCLKIIKEQNEPIYHYL